MLKDITLETIPAENVTTDLLAIGLMADQSPSRVIARFDDLLKGELRREVERRAFAARAGAALLLPTYGELPARYLLLFGMGAAPSPQNWRLLGEAALINARGVKATRFAITAPSPAPADLQAVAEGLSLSAYEFRQYKGGAAPANDDLLASLALPGAAAYSPAHRQAVEAGRRAAAATNFTRDLINTPAQDATPEFLADAASTIARQNEFRFEAYDRAGIEKLKMGGLLGVAKASSREPRFIELSYQPSPSAAHIALVGKGITFDSGGLNLKPAAAMEEQKRDMTGAALMLGVMSELAYFAPSLGVRAYLPCSENMIGPDATKPGDVLRIRSGKTVEVLNTDAEGRLVLADALSYACEFQPRAVLDAGTLTAAVRAALGTRVGAMMGSDAALLDALRAAGQDAGESLWELPLVAEYADELRSSAIADLRNIGTSGNAGTIICGLFLKEFVSCPSWAHLDLSGVSFTNRALPLTPPGAVGFGVRTLLRYVTGAR